MEKVLSNVEICLHIFQYLNLEEQLNLTHVSEEFRYIIKSYLWRTTFKELQLYAVEKNVYMITNKVSNRQNCGKFIKPKYLLCYNGCEIKDSFDKTSIIFKNKKDVMNFVSTNKNNIEKLQLLRESNINGNETSQSFDFIWKYKFENLIKIEMFGVTGLSQSMRNIYSNCPKLTTLILRNCYGEGTESILNDPEGISVIALIKTLKKLVIFENYMGQKYKQSLVLRIMNDLKHLKELILDITITTSSEENCDVTTEHLPNTLCEVLSLGSIELANNRITIPTVIVTSLLHNFQYLQVLAIKPSGSPITIQRKTVEALIKLCPSLKNLFLQFCNFEEFIPIPSLEILTLANIDGIKWKDFKALVKQTNLQSFTSAFVRFCENFELFHIESPLQYLHIETADYDFRDDLRKLLEYNSNRLTSLKTLVWHDFTVWYKCSPISLHLQLKDHYENLQSLYIDLAVVDIENIMQMKCLKCLAFIENDFVNVEHLLRVFKHPSVENFKLYNRNLVYTTKCPDNFIMFKTSLQTIEIPLTLFNCCTHIWLRLLTENVNLRIFCYFYNYKAIDLTFLRNLIDQDLFPERIQTLKLCGFIIDRNCMQSNIDDILAKITIAKKLCKLLNRTMYLEL